MDIVLYGYGSTTFRKQAEASGLEPDECYCIDTWKDIPDFAIEVNLTSGNINKLKVYQALGIPEVLIWHNHQLTLYDLRGESYTQIQQSQFFPELDWQLLAKYISPEEQPQAVKAFLHELRSQSN
jgi:Uma2 family endonuclease